jgi:sulfur carrier protein ThiS
LADVARVSFAKAIQRHAACPPADVAGDTLRGVLDGYFEVHPAARTYVLDERGAVRKHVAVFVNETLVLDREQLSDSIAADDRVTVFQALSGGAT